VVAHSEEPLSLGFAVNGLVSRGGTAQSGCARVMR
jgi:hypothetical protein